MLLARWRREHKDDTGYTKEVQAGVRPDRSDADRLLRDAGVRGRLAPRAAPRALHRRRRRHPARQAAGPLPLHPGAARRSSSRRSRRGSRCSSRRGRSATSSSPSLRRLEADLGVVVAYGHILRPEVLDAPARGMINVHASLLPRFRGAAPIQHAILAGDRETGISIMQMEEGLDSGPVLHRVATPIADGETAGALDHPAGRARRHGAGGGALAARRPGSSTPAAAGRRPPRPTRPRSPGRRPGSTGRRDAGLARAAGARLRSGARRVDHARRSAGQALRRACRRSGGGEPGTVLAASDRLVVAGGNGAIAVREVQPAGRNRLAVEEWVRGRGIAAGSRFE